MADEGVPTDAGAVVAVVSIGVATAADAILVVA